MERYRLSEVLLSIPESDENLLDFQKATIALWAIKACRRDKGIPKTGPISKDDFRRIAGACMEYQLADPISGEDNSNFLGTLLRIYASQRAYDETHREFGRAYVLWHQLPPTLKERPEIKFDLLKAYQNVHGMSPLPFIKLLLTVYCATIKKNKLVGSYFATARNENISIPGDQEVHSFLSLTGGTQSQLKALAKKYQCVDRKYAPYDLNPLMFKPIIRPWSKVDNLAEEGLIVPVPGLLGHRASIGSYYALFNEYKLEFSQYYGFLQEEYLGLILKECSCSSQLISEKELLPEIKEGNSVVDWCLREGDTAVVFESKARGYNRSVMVTGRENELRASLDGLRQGVKQCSNFISKAINYSALKGVRNFKSVIVVREPMHLINIHPMKELGGEEFRNVLILSISEIEQLQMFSTKGVSVLESVELLQKKGNYEGMLDLSERTKALNKHSFLFRKFEELLKSVVPSE